MITLPRLADLEILTERPGQCYIAKGGKELYVSTPDKEVLLLTGPDFTTMSDAEISAWIITQVSPKD